MEKEKFITIENYMLDCMKDNVHDHSHIYRVLYLSLRIGAAEGSANPDILILSAMLHDIGRDAENKDKSLCHAQVGSQMAAEFLRREGWAQQTCDCVQDCIITHSYKGGRQPNSLEAKILFDADKLDLSGAVGTARAILFGGQINEPLYLVDENGYPTKGLAKEDSSLFREYNRKLSILNTRFYTSTAKSIAKERQKIVDAYFSSLFQEVEETYYTGKTLLNEILT